MTNFFFHKSFSFKLKVKKNAVKLLFMCKVPEVAILVGIVFPVPFKSLLSGFDLYLYVHYLCRTQHFPFQIGLFYIIFKTRGKSLIELWVTTFLPD